jgi:glutamate dehydrogenase
VARWGEVEALDGRIDPLLQNELMKGVDWLVEATSRWYLVQADGQRPFDAVGEARDSFAELAAAIDQVGPEAWREVHEQAAQELIAQGVPEPVARRHAFQSEMVHGPDIIAVSHRTGRTPLDVARVFFALGERLEIDWLENQLEALPARTRWQRWAQQSIEDDLFGVRRQISERVIAESGDAPPDEAVDAFLEAHAETVARFRRFHRGLAVEGVRDLAQLAVALRQFRALAG